MLLRSHGSKSRKSLIFRLSVLAVAIGSLGVKTTVTSAAVPGWKMIVREGANPFIIRMGEQKDADKMSPDDLKQRGIKLRAELEEVFDKLWRSGKLDRQIDVTSSMAPYISAGMTFEESESILRAAGFTVDPHPGAREAQDPNRARDWYVVYAEIRNFSRHVLGSVTVAVTLHPESPGDYSNVKEVSATIFVEHL